MRWAPTGASTPCLRRTAARSWPRRGTGELGRVSWILGDGIRDPDRSWQGGGTSRCMGMPGRADNAARADLGANTALKIRETWPSVTCTARARIELQLHA